MENLTQVKKDQRRQFITFRSDDQGFGTDIMSIREIRGWTETTPLPYAPSYVQGVINLRGVVLPVVDLKAQLGFSATEVTPKHVIIVVHTRGRTVGLLVDAVSDIVEASATDMQPVPELAREAQNQFAEGIGVIDGRLITILSMEKITTALAGIEEPSGQGAQETSRAAA